MSLARPLLALSLLSGCGGGQLDALEADQRELRQEYDELAANVEALKLEMVDLGLLTQAQANARVRPSKGGKTGKAGKPQPGPRGALGNELDGQLPWTASRTGEVPSLDSLAPPERADGACGWKFTSEALQPLSDFPLNRDGYGKSSPVRLWEDGQPLTPHAGPDAFAETCAGAFRHAGFLFLYSPNGTVDDGARRTYELRLAEEFPVPRGDDARPMYWVYPGTTVTFDFEGAWEESWGEPRLTVSGRVIKPEKGTAQLQAPGVAKGLDAPGDFSISERITPGEGSFSVSLSSSTSGPYVLIDALTLGTADSSLVVTSRAGWAQ